MSNGIPGEKIKAGNQSALVFRMPACGRWHVDILAIDCNDIVPNMCGIQFVGRLDVTVLIFLFADREVQACLG